MTTRSQMRTEIRECLDALHARLGYLDAAPDYDWDLLTIREHVAAKRLFELLEVNGARNFHHLDYLQKVLLRALLRKAANELDLDSPTSVDDRRDVSYLARINTDNFHVEKIDQFC